MSELLKGKSPFYPGQPVPTDLFVGRNEQIVHVMERGATQVQVGKPATCFVQGEYGIGKSSLAVFLQQAAEAKYRLHPVYALLGGGDDLQDIAVSIVQATIRSGAFNPNRSEKIKNWLAKYIGKQSLAGVSFNMDALKQDAPSVATPFGLLDFLMSTLDKIRDTGVSGLFVVLDEINGITKDPKFAHFIKALVDTNAMAPEPLPLLLMICGAEARRRDMIDNHPPIDRIFDVVDLPVMSTSETVEFFKGAFESVKTSATPEALQKLAFYSAGLPKIMHIMGDEAFWASSDDVIDEGDVMKAVVRAADDVGKKFVDQQVYAALRSPDYRSILKKIAAHEPLAMSFKKSEVVGTLTEGETRKFNNFLQKMKHLNVLRSDPSQGEYIFNARMVRVYIWLESERGDAPL